MVSQRNIVETRVAPAALEWKVAEKEWSGNELEEKIRHLRATHQILEDEANEILKLIEVCPGKEAAFIQANEILLETKKEEAVGIRTMTNVVEVALKGETWKKDRKQREAKKLSLPISSSKLVKRFAEKYDKIREELNAAGMEITEARMRGFKTVWREFGVEEMVLAEVAKVVNAPV